MADTTTRILAAASEDIKQGQFIEIDPRTSRAKVWNQPEDIDPDEFCTRCSKGPNHSNHRKDVKIPGIDHHEFKSLTDLL